MTRIPTQKRSIETRDKIIESGFNLITKNGYYNTNTAEIAQYAGVSTGIIYSYFKDKHDILIEGLSRYGDSIFFPMLNITIDYINKVDLETIISKMIDKFIENHNMSKKAHEEIVAMIHLDKEVAEYFRNRDIKMTKKIYEVLKNNGYESPNLMEKIHIMNNLIDNLCHEIVYHNHEELNSNEMKTLVTKCIINLLENE